MTICTRWGEPFPGPPLSPPHVETHWCLACYWEWRRQEEEAGREEPLETGEDLPPVLPPVRLRPDERMAASFVRRRASLQAKIGHARNHVRSAEQDLREAEYELAQLEAALCQVGVDERRWEQLALFGPIRAEPLPASAAR